MKRFALFIIVAIMLTFQAEAKKIAGRIIYEKNDTTYVTLNVPFKLLSSEPNYEKLQYKVKYFNPSGVKIIVKPDQAKEIQFNYNNENIRMISVYNSLMLGNLFTNCDNIFLKLEIDGKLKLFSYYYTQQSAGYYNAATGTMSGGSAYSIEKYILQKGNEELVQPYGLGFKKDMAEYFSDCLELAQKIRNKEFRKNDIEAIVHYYNSHCNK
jgi:hypothetical protein